MFKKLPANVATMGQEASVMQPEELPAADKASVWAVKGQSSKRPAARAKVERSSPARKQTTLGEDDVSLNTIVSY